ncbi:hypothetical protein COBT_001467 [Conglomerata obtusa]
MYVYDDSKEKYYLTNTQGIVLRWQPKEDIKDLKASTLTMEEWGTNESDKPKESEETEKPKEESPDEGKEADKDEKKDDTDPGSTPSSGVDDNSGTSEGSGASNSADNMGAPGNSEGTFSGNEQNNSDSNGTGSSSSGFGERGSFSLGSGGYNGSNSAGYLDQSSKDMNSKVQENSKHKTITEGGVWGLDSKGLYCGAQENVKHDDGPFIPQAPKNPCKENGILMFPFLGPSLNQSICGSSVKGSSILDDLARPKDDEEKKPLNKPIADESGMMNPGRYAISNLKRSMVVEGDPKNNTEIKEDAKTDKEPVSPGEELYQIRLNGMFISKSPGDSGLILDKANTAKETKWTIKKIGDNTYNIKQGDLCLGLLPQKNTKSYYGNAKVCSQVVNEIHFESV